MPLGQREVGGLSVGSAARTWCQSSAWCRSSAYRRLSHRLAPQDLEFTELPIGNLPLYSPDYDGDPLKARR